VSWSGGVKCRVS